MSKPLLTASSLSLLRQTKPLLKNISLTLYHEQTIVLIGHNGAGKSLLLHALHGLIETDSGMIESLSSQDQKMVFQKPILLHRTALAHFQFATQNKDIAVADHWFEKAKLTDKKTVAARALSAGEQQKLAMISALATKPILLFLDEPTANLDQESTKDIELLIQQAKDDGTTIMMISHSIKQAQRLADRIIFMHHAEVLDDCAANSFFAGHHSQQAQLFIKER